MTDSKTKYPNTFLAINNLLRSILWLAIGFAIGIGAFNVPFRWWHGLLIGVAMVAYMLIGEFLKNKIIQDS